MENKNLQFWLNSPISENDKFWIGESKYQALGQQGTTMICCTIFKDDKILSGEDRIRITIANPKIIKKEEDYEGPNPFLPNNIRFIAFDIANILSMIGYNRREGKKMDDEGMPYFNWNPYFVINGEKHFYQRGYVWNLEQKRALIDTIYRGLESGRLIIHSHSWAKQEKMVKAGYTDFASRDIVDGKQRLSTIIEFIENKFPDNYGNYYIDLSKRAQMKFMNYSGLLYGEMDENCSIEQICDAFLNNATQGTPISIEHIKYMEEIKTKL